MEILDFTYLSSQYTTLHNAMSINLFLLSKLIKLHLSLLSLLIIMRDNLLGVLDLVNQSIFSFTKYFNKFFKSKISSFILNSIIEFNCYSSIKLMSSQLNDGNIQGFVIKRVEALWLKIYK